MEAPFPKMSQTEALKRAIDTMGELQSADSRQPSAQQERPSAQAVLTVTVGVASSA
jgi:hypothetical protein